MFSTKKMLKLLKERKNRGRILINKELFDKYSNKKEFLSNFTRDEIKDINKNTLLYIIENDPDSLNYLDNRSLEFLFYHLPKSLITIHTIGILYGGDHEQFLQKNFQKYFSHIPLYIPLNGNKQPYKQYRINSLSGYHTFPLNNPIIWDLTTFTWCTDLAPIYLSEIRLNKKSTIHKLERSYLEVDNFQDLIQSEPQRIIRE